MSAELLNGVLEADGVTGVRQPFTAYVAAHRTSTLTDPFRALATVGDAAILITSPPRLPPDRRGSRIWRPLWNAALTRGSS